VQNVLGGPLPDLGMAGIGIFTDPSQNVSCLAPSTAFHATPRRLASCRIFLISSDRFKLLRQERY
jgi:hypothetical protein